MGSSNTRATFGADTYRGHLPILDGIRGVAIAMVLGFHYCTFDHHFWPAHIFYLVTRAGWLGVDLFFVLSGFLITGILLDAKEQPKHFFRRFYVRRTLRIFPLYYLVLFLFFGLFSYTEAFQEPTFRELESQQVYLWLYLVNWVNWARSSLLFVSNSFEANHFWSLAAEEQFYLLWPALVFVLSRQTLARLALILVALSFAAKAAFAPHELTLTLWRSDALLVGSVLAMWVREDSTRARLERAAGPTCAASIAVLVALFFLRGGLAHDDPWMARVGVTAFVILSASALIALIRSPSESRIARLLRMRPLLFLGTYSYGIYVLHWAFNPLVARYVLPHVEHWTTAIPWVGGNALFVKLILLTVQLTLALTAAWISFHAFEKHWLKLKDRAAPRAT